MDALTPLIQSTYTTSTLGFFLNGTKVELANPNPEWTLLDFIRTQHGLRGTKSGCGEGGCGACTVVLQYLDQRTKGRVKHLTVNACLFPLVGVDGKHVITIEGLGNVTTPHPLQERIAKLHGSQCGFCTPGIVMSLYALIRNAYDPESGNFKLSERDIELEGHLDGNLCRCTGYKPILQAAKTFVREDLKADLIDSSGDNSTLKLQEDHEDHEDQSDAAISQTNPSCGRPGVCCRDTVDSASCNANESHEASSTESSFEKFPGDSTSEEIVSSPPSSDSEHDDGQSRRKADDSVSPIKLIPYIPSTELIFPPSLRKWTKIPICYGNSRKKWFRPTTVQQLVELKHAYPHAKLVGGATEIQIQVRFGNSEFPVSVYVSDIEELSGIEMPKSPQALDSMEEVIIHANTPLTEVERICKEIYSQLGRRGLVLKAIAKQLRYFGGRQIRNVASLAGNIATASPMSGLNPLFIVIRATVALRSITKGEFTMPLESFFTSYRTTVLPADAVIIRIHIPLPKPGEREITMTYTSKQAKRKDDDMATVVSAYRVKLDHENVVKDVALAYGGIGPMAIEAKDAMMVLNGKKWFDPETLQAVTQTLLKIFDLPLSIAGGMAAYRRTLVTSLFLRFWHDVAAELDIGSIDPELTREIQRDISSGTRDNYNPNEQRVVGKQLVTLSALKQSTGEALYIDDMPKQDSELFGAILFSERAHAKLVSVDWSPALELPGVKGYVDKTSITPEANVWGPIVKDEPFFADGVVGSHGQPIGMVYAETALQAHAGVKAVKVQYEDLPHILTIDEAIEQKSFFQYGRDLRKGAGLTSAMKEAFIDCDRIFEGVTRMGGQEHFYLETNAAMVIPNAEDGAVEVWSSTQNAMETQIFVAEVLKVPSNRVNVRVKRMGGAFGGKECRSVPLACILAIAAKKERRPMRCMLNRDEDMIYSGQRHPIQARWKVGTTKDGKLLALEADVYDNAGYTCDMSGAVMDRALTHIDNCYEIPNVLLRGHVCKTNTHSNTAFRGFGGPQAMFITESIMAAIAEGLHIPIDDLRLENLYKQGDRTPFLQEIDQDWHVPLILSQLKTESDYENRKIAIQKFNATNKWKKRGISLIPTKFGLSFATAIHLNQGAANVKIYHDGSILLHHGGTEMGQGLYTKMSQVAAQELGVPMESIYTDDSSTYVIPNASPTAASSGSDLNGMAIKNACDQLNERLRPYRDRLGPGASMKEIAHEAYLDRVNLAASGFWKMPRVGYQWGSYDVDTVQPMYYYFTQGAAVSEVELDVLTGDHTVLRTDIKMDIGRSINPAIDYGQIEGAFTQGLGLFTLEQSLWNPTTGQLHTRGPGTYKIPTFTDIPQVFNTSLLQGVSWNHLRSIQSSKGIGEPPLFLGCTVLFALREALVSARADHMVPGGNGEGGGVLVLDSPATAERLRLGVGDGLVRAAEVRGREGEKGGLIAVE